MIKMIWNENSQPKKKKKNTKKWNGNKIALIFCMLLIWNFVIATLSAHEICGHLSVIAIITAADTFC